MNIYTVSLGCSKNRVDTEVILGDIVDRVPNVVLVSSPEDADYVLVNTCGFLRTARQEALDTLTVFKNKKIILLGCLTPFVTPAFLRKYQNVIAIIRQGDYHKLPDLLSYLSFRKKVVLTESPLSLYDQSLHSRVLTSSLTAYLKIAEGCNAQCSYCLIPFIRGPYRSKPIEDILQEAQMLVDGGITELILIAQDTSCYGMDLYGKGMLLKLLQQLCSLRHLHWIRLHYTYPERITPELVNLIAAEKKIVPYLDIPFQHASPRILRKMNRSPDIQKWRGMVFHIRRVIPEICLRTSLIIGFPGETDHDQQLLKNFLEEIKFDRVGFFPFSREKGTAAYFLPRQVPVSIRQGRLREVIKLQQAVSFQKNSSLVGKTIEVLIEGYDPKSKMFYGRSYRDSPDIDGQVFISGDSCTVGTFCHAHINKATVYDLIAVVA